MPNPALYISKHLAGIDLIPAPVQLLGREAELHNEIAREVLRFDFASFLPPQPQQGSLIIAHDDPGIRPADEIAAIGGSTFRIHATLLAAISAF
jgi:hypothetical protein